jgi:hypothetical protein
MPDQARRKQASWFETTDTDTRAPWSPYKLAVADNAASRDVYGLSWRFTVVRVGF